MDTQDTETKINLTISAEQALKSDPSFDHLVILSDF